MFARKFLTRILTQERGRLWKAALSMPMSFREQFKEKIVVFVSCFELKSQKKNKILVYSNHKKI